MNNPFNLTQVQHQKLTTDGIAAVMRKNKKGIIALLKNNGVNIDSSYDDHAIIVGVLQAVRSTGPNAQRFRTDLANLMAQMASKGMQSFTDDAGTGGFYNWVDPPTDSALAPVGAPPLNQNTGGTKTPNTGIFSPNNLATIFNTGLGILSTSLTNKSNQQLAQTALQIEQEKTRQAALVGAGGAGGGVKKGLSAGAWIAIIIGVLGLGGIIYFAFIKKK